MELFLIFKILLSNKLRFIIRGTEQVGIMRYKSLLVNKLVGTAGFKN